MDINVRHLAAQPARKQRLVQVYAGMWQGVAAARVTSYQQDGAKTGRLPYTGRHDRRADRTHRIVDRQACCDDATWRINVHVDVALSALAGKEEQLGNDQTRHVVIYRAVDQHNPLAQQSRV